METEKKFIEMTIELARVFEIAKIDYSEENGLTNGGKLTLYSGLIVEIKYTQAKMDIHYRYIKSHGITKRMRNEMIAMKEIFDSCYETIKN